jgi:hypothetical protein
MVPTAHLMHPRTDGCRKETRSQSTASGSCRRVNVRVGSSDSRALPAYGCSYRRLLHGWIKERLSLPENGGLVALETASPAGFLSLVIVYEDQVEGTGALVFLVKTDGRRRPGPGRAAPLPCNRSDCRIPVPLPAPSIRVLR